MRIGLWGWLLAAWALPAQDEEKVQVNFMGMDLEVVAQQVERVTKKSFLFQPEVLRGKKVTLRSDRRVGPDELYQVFQTICHMQGLTLVPTKSQGIEIVKIVQTAQAPKEPGSQPILRKGDALPSGDTLVYYLLAPRHLPAPRAMAVLSSAISQTGSLQQVAGTELVLLVDVASAIERAERLLSMVDQPGPPVEHRAVSLAHLQAAAARARLGEHLSALDRAQGIDSARPRLQVLSDDRLNRLDLYGPLEDVERAEAYLRGIDQDLPPARRTIQYYKLKNVSASDVADGVRQLLGLAIAARETERKGEEKPAAVPAPPPVPGRPPELPGRPVPPQAPAPTPGAPEPRAAPPVGAPAGGLPPDVEVVPLESQSMLVVVGSPAVHEEVRKILENLDRRKGQVLIEVAIVQVTGDDSLDFGVEFLQEDVKGGGAIVSGGTGFGLSTQTSPSGSGFPTVQTLTSLTGGAVRYLKPQDISVLVKALATRAQVNILSQPLLLVNDNEDADFTTKVSEPTVAVSQGTVGNITSFAGFAEAVTSLRIVPQISPDGYLNLKITQNFEEFTGQSASGIPPPKVSNSVTTQITVPDRYTAILGGFTRDAATESRSGLPLLKDLPLVGALTSHTTTKVTKSRLYLFVRPRILSTDGFGDLKDTSKEKVRDVRSFTQGSPIEPALREALRPYGGPAVKEGPLPFGPEEGVRR